MWRKLTFKFRISLFSAPSPTFVRGYRNKPIVWICVYMLYTSRIYVLEYVDWFRVIRTALYIHRLCVRVCVGKRNFYLISSEKWKKFTPLRPPPHHSGWSRTGWRTGKRLTRNSVLLLLLLLCIFYFIFLSLLAVCVYIYTHGTTTTVTAQRRWQSVGWKKHDSTPFRVQIFTKVRFFCFNGIGVQWFWGWRDSAPDGRCRATAVDCYGKVHTRTPSHLQTYTHVRVYR